MLEFANYVNVGKQEPKDHGEKQKAYDFIAYLLRDLKNIRLLSSAYKNITGTVDIGGGLTFEFTVYASSSYAPTVTDFFCLNVLYAKRFHRVPLQILSESEKIACKKFLSSSQPYEAYFRLNSIGIKGKIYDSKDNPIWESKGIYPLMNPAYFLYLAGPETDFFYKLYLVRSRALWPNKDRLKGSLQSSHNAQVKVLYKEKIEKAIAERKQKTSPTPKRRKRSEHDSFMDSVRKSWGL